MHSRVAILPGFRVIHDAGAARQHKDAVVAWRCGASKDSPTASVPGWRASEDEDSVRMPAFPATTDGYPVMADTLRANRG